MPIHNFSQLVSTYPDVIEKMPQQFNSHEFIRELSKQHQVPYVEALYAYRDALRDGKPAPFMIVHGILAQKLMDFPELVRQVSPGVESIDMFGASNTASKWEKLK